MHPLPAMLWQKRWMNVQDRMIPLLQQRRGNLSHVTCQENEIDPVRLEGANQYIRKFIAIFKLIPRDVETWDLESSCHLMDTGISHVRDNYGTPSRKSAIPARLKDRFRIRPPTGCHDTEFDHLISTWTLYNQDREIIRLLGMFWESFFRFAITGTFVSITHFGGILIM